MERRKICFIAQFPPPIHGLSKAVDTLYNSSVIQEKYELEKIDITNNKAFFKNVFKIMSAHADLFYFTNSQTKGGNLRDLVILKILSAQKKKCLMHLHGGYYRTLVEGMPSWQKKANYRAVKKLDGTVVLGKSLKWIFEGMLPNEKIYVVPNCVDDQYIMSDDAFEDKMNALRGAEIKHVLYLSNFIRTKGYDEVLNMARLEKNYVDAGGRRTLSFDFAGKFFDENEKEFFDSYVNEHNLQEYVTYHGVVQGEVKVKLLNDSSFFMLPTRYPNEGQPISILEAQGNGIVVISTDHAGIPDIVKDNVTGILLKKDQHADVKLLERIHTLDTEKMARDARKSIMNAYRQENYISNMVKTFDTVLGGEK